MGNWAGSAGISPARGTGDGTARADLGAGDGDLAFQSRILGKVSRTFALTIPQLPPRLCEVVSNAYLLCRIADSIEDDADLGWTAKQALAEEFVAVVAGSASPESFAAGLAPRLSPSTPPAERELIRRTPSVIRLTHGYRPAEREALERCVRVMARGMAEFQAHASPAGLADLAALDRYCYHVAGVVGEMLTALFCEHAPDIARHRDRLMPLAVSFGQGLQMTNILKDVHEDLSRGACWLPRETFERHGFDLRALLAGLPRPAGFAGGLEELIGVAHRHLRAALDYALLVPAGHPGIRRFCLWAIGMALLTLRRLRARPDFRSGEEVKISRRAVRGTVAVTSLMVGSDRGLRGLFRAAACGLPVTTAPAGADRG